MVGRKLNSRGVLSEYPWEKGLKKPVQELWYIHHGTGELRSDGGPWMPIRTGMMVWFHAGRFYEWHQDPNNPLGVNFFHFDFVGKAPAGLSKLRETLDAYDPAFVDALSRRIIELYWEEYFDKVVQGGKAANPAKVPTPFFESEPEPVRRDVFLPQTMSIEIPRHGRGALSELAVNLFQGLIGEYLHVSTMNLSIEEAGIRRLHRMVIADLVARIQSDLGNVPSVRAMAAQCGYGIDHFGRVFRKIMGCSAQDFIIRARIAKARQLLLESGLSVKEIAVKIGYTSQFFFSRQFKSLTGESPSDFRNRHEKQAKR
jgi:AraC-like DNA-binding protein